MSYRTLIGVMLRTRKIVLCSMVPAVLIIACSSDQPTGPLSLSNSQRSLDSHPCGPKELPRCNCPSDAYCCTKDGGCFHHTETSRLDYTTCRSEPSAVCAMPNVPQVPNEGSASQHVCSAKELTRCNCPGNFYCCPTDGGCFKDFGLIQYTQCKDNHASACAMSQSTPGANPSAPAPQPTSPGTPDQNPPAQNPPAQNPGGNPLIRVLNNCPFPLWIHAQGSSGVLQPDDAKLGKTESRTYVTPPDWKSARVTAYLDGPRQNEIDKVEMTFEKTNAQWLHYNVTYVDWVGLPFRVEGVGTGGDCKPAECRAPVASILAGCPDGLREGNKCMSPRTYCANPANHSKPVCKKLDAKIQECARRYPECAPAAQYKSPEVYGCNSGTFLGESPKWCAALNRGMIDNPDSADKSKYYQQEPYNTYSKWVHDICPGIYAFSYDDYPSNAGESGYHACENGTELKITLCPGG